MADFGTYYYLQFNITIIKYKNKKQKLQQKSTSALVASFPLFLQIPCRKMDPDLKAFASVQKIIHWVFSRLDLYTRRCQRVDFFGSSQRKKKLLTPFVPNTFYSIIIQFEITVLYE